MPEEIERHGVLAEDFDLPEQFSEIFKLVDSMLTMQLPVNDYETMRGHLTPVLVRTVLSGTTFRHCMVLECWKHFDMLAALTGDKAAPGWLQSRSLGGFLCPEHAWMWEEHHPGWGQLPETVLTGVQPRAGFVCPKPCRWTSGPISHQGLAKELWRSHARDVLEAREREEAGYCAYAESRTEEDDAFDRMMHKRPRSGE